MIDMRGIMAVAFAGIGALLGLIIGIPIFRLVAVMDWTMFWAFVPRPAPAGVVAYRPRNARDRGP